MLIPIEFESINSEIPIVFDSVIEVSSATDIYEGPYSINPTVDGVVLNTSDKYMRKNLSINPIPRYDVENSSGGNTVYIAK